MEKKKILLLSIATTTLLALSVALFMINNVGAFTFNIQADNNPYTLNLNRSITASELSTGQATFNTTNGSPISFKFDSNKASGDSGLITLNAGGFFYNDTKITGITKIETTLSRGSATLIYGNEKSSLHIGSEILSGTSQITIDLAAPSDYFKITDVSSSLSISSLKITYSCSNFYEPDIHEAAEEFTSSSAWADGLPNHYFVSPADSKVLDMSTDTIAFDVKFISNSGVLSFYLNEFYYGKYCGPFALSTSGVLTGKGASLTPLEDGWYRITINLSETTKSATEPEYVSRVNLSGTTANGFIKYMGTIEPDIHKGAKKFTSSSAWADGAQYYYFVSPADSKVLDMSTDTIAFDVMFWSNSGALRFYLNEFYYGKYCGPFALTTSGVLTGKGAYLTSLEEGWYRITINLSETVKGNNPAFVSSVNLSGTTANGFIKYMGTVTDIHEDAEEFTSSSAWADGLPNHYFVSPADSKVLDMSTDTIAFDVKFSSDSGVLSFYLNEFYYGKYCGPFALTTTGVLTGKGASLTSLGEVWYRITINLSETTKSAPEPEYVSRVNLVGTTANGFIKYMGTIK